MSAALIAAVGVVYFVIAADLYRSGQPGLALAFAGYAVGWAVLGGSLAHSTPKSLENSTAIFLLSCP